jgi:hypothetical protein
MFGKATPCSDQQVIVELDARMNHWMDAVPSHRMTFSLRYRFIYLISLIPTVKWNRYCDNQLFLKQSAALHATYYHMQIFIHRPFIPTPRNPNPIAFPSLAICTNAARSCCHVLESFTRLSALPLAHLQARFFSTSTDLIKSDGHFFYLLENSVCLRCDITFEHLERKKVWICAQPEEGNGGCSAVYGGPEGV